MDGTDVRALPARIEALLDGLAGAGDPTVADAAHELVAAVLHLYGEGLARVVRGLAPDDVRRLAGDDLVSALLLLHDLHPDDVDTRIQRALDRVRPYLGSHAGGVTYAGVDPGGVAHLRLEGSCDGCAGSAATVHDAVERAVVEAAPEVRRVDVAGLVESTQPQLLQIGIRCPDGLVEAVAR